MIIKVIKSALLGLAIISSQTAFASLITHNGYTLDTNTQIVSNSETEWLQWSLTRGVSIEDALGTYAGQGWSLANNIQMVSLFDDFGWDASENENVASVNLADYTDATDISAMDNFIELFGSTRYQEGPSYGTGIGALNYTIALFGSDLDLDGYYNNATIRSDYQKLLNQVFPTTDDGAILYTDSLTLDWSNQFYGVALVRAVSVPEPTTLSFFVLALFGLLFRHVKANISEGK